MAKKKEETTNEPIRFEEKSRAQIITSFGGRLTNPLPASYKTYRIIRQQPTIWLTRALVSAAVMAGNWTVEADDDVDDPDDEKKNFIRDQFVPRRDLIMEHSIKYGKIDFGWMPFEIVFGLTNDGLVGIEKVKPLLQDITDIIVNADTGAFLGYEQMNSGKSVTIEKKYTLHVAFGVEGTQWHGTSLLENIREYLNQWREANAGAERYDAKIAGAHWIIYFPIGTNIVNDILTDNATIAQSMLDALESSGSLCVPDAVAGYAKELTETNPMWRIELLEDKGGRQPTFVDRLKYLDTLLVRGLEMPERAILEGQFGTKAEAGAHGDVSVTNVTQWDERVTNIVNEGPVDELLVQNWGEELRGKIFLVPAPLVDAQLTFLRALYTSLLTNQATALDVFPTINLDALADHLGVPKSEETVEPGEAPDPGLDPMQAAFMASRKFLEDDSFLTRLGKRLGWITTEEQEEENED